MDKRRLKKKVGNKLSRIEHGNRIDNLMLKTLLRRFGMTQRDLADKTGIHYDTIRNWSSGRYTVSTPNLELLAKALDVPIEFFTGRTKDKVKDAMVTTFQDALLDYHFEPDVISRKMLQDSIKLMAPYYVPTLAQYLQAQGMIMNNGGGDKDMKVAIEEQMESLGLPSNADDVDEDYEEQKDKVEHYDTEREEVIDPDSEDLIEGEDPDDEERFDGGPVVVSV